MGMVGQCSGASNPGRVFSSPVEAAVVEVALILIAHSSLVRLFPLWRTLYRHIYMLPNVQGSHQSFPFAKLNEAIEYVTENKDAVESEGDEDSDANLGDSDNFSDGNDSDMSEDENDSDDGESSEGDSDEEGDDNEDDNDDDSTDEDEDSDDEDDDEDEEEDEEEEKRQLPIKKKK